MLSDKSTLIRTVGMGTFWSLLGSVLSKGIGLATVFLILSRLNVYEYGLVELVMSIVPVFSIFLLPGLTQVVIADMGVEKGRGDIGTMKGIFWNYFYIQLTFGVLALIIIFLGSHVLADAYQTQASDLIRIISFLFLLSPFRSLFQVWFSSEHKFFERNVYSLLEEAGKLVIIAIFIATLDIGPKAIVLATILSQLVPMILMGRIFLRSYRFFSDTRAKSLPFWSLIRFHGKWGLMSNYLNSLGPNMRLWFIKLFLGTEAVGIFSVAQGLLSHTLSLIPLSNILSSVTPHYMHQKERFHLLVNKAIKYQCISHAVLGALAFLIFPMLLGYLFPRYVSALPVFNILLLSLIPNAVAAVITPVFHTFKAQKELFGAVALKNIFVLILSPLLIGWYGLSGAAWELVITTIFFVWNRYRKVQVLSPGFRLSGVALFRIDENDRLIVGKIYKTLARWLRLPGMVN